MRRARRASASSRCAPSRRNTSRATPSQADRAARELFALLPGVFRLFLPRAAKHAPQRVVPFVAGVLVQVLVGGVPRVLTCPGPIPRLRILDRESIQDGVFVAACEAFDDVQLIARPAELRLVREIRGVDD